MGQNVNRPPFNLIPNKWAFDPELGPFVRELLTQLWQLRIRTGGDDDIVGDTQAEIIAEDSRRLPELRQTSRKITALTNQIETLQSQAVEIEKLKRKVKDLEALLQTSENLHSIKRRLDQLEMQVN